MEEDIKILDEVVGRSKELREKDFGMLIGTKQMQSIENLIKGYRELEEKYKEELDDGLKMSEWIVLKQKQIEELEYKYDKAISDLSIDAHRLNEAQYVIKLKDEDYRNLVDVIQKDSIPKSKVKEKIEELNKNELLCKMNFENIKFTIQVLQELMEDK